MAVEFTHPLGKFHASLPCRRSLPVILFGLSIIAAGLWCSSLSAPVEAPSIVKGWTAFCGLVTVLGALVAGGRAAKNSTAAVVSAVGGLLASFLVPYSLAETEDQVLLRMLAYQQPQLFPHDLLRQSTEDSGPYNAFAWLLSLCPESQLPFFLYVGWLACWVLLSMGIYRLLRDVLRTERPLVGCWLLMLALGLSYKWQRFGGFALGDNDLVYPFLRNQMFAWVAVAWALHAWFQARSVRAGLFTAAALALHINTGQHALMLMAVDALACRRIQPFARMAGAALLLSAPAVIPLMKSEISGHSDAMPGSFLLISAYLRHPHHLVMSSWPKLLYVQYGLFLLIGLLAWCFGTRRSPLDRRLLLLAGAANVFFFANYFLVECWHMDLGAKLQLARMTLFVKLVLLLYIAHTISGLVPRVNFKIKPLLCPVALVLLPALALTGRHAAGQEVISPLETFFLQKTPTDATVLLPPFEFAHFSSHACRSCVVNGFLMPFTPPFHEEYYRRVMEISGMKGTGLPPARIQSLGELSQGYHQLTQRDLDSLRDLYGFDYVVRKKSLQRTPLGWSKVYEDQLYVVYGCGTAATKLQQY